MSMVSQFFENRSLKADLAFPVISSREFHVIYRKKPANIKQHPTDQPKNCEVSLLIPCSREIQYRDKFAAV